MTSKFLDAIDSHKDNSRVRPISTYVPMVAEEELRFKKELVRKEISHLVYGEVRERFARLYALVGYHVEQQDARKEIFDLLHQIEGKMR